MSKPRFDLDVPWLSDSAPGSVACMRKLHEEETGNHENLNGTSSSSSHINNDLYELPSEPESKRPEIAETKREDDFSWWKKREQIQAEKRSHGNCVSSSSSSSSLGINIDLNELPSNSDQREEEPQSLSLSLSLFSNYNNPKPLPNPNSQSSSSREKRPHLLVQESGGYYKKKAKRRPEEDDPRFWKLSSLLDVVEWATEEFEQRKAKERNHGASTSSSSMALLYETPSDRKEPEIRPFSFFAANNLPNLNPNLNLNPNPNPNPNSQSSQSSLRQYARKGKERAETPPRQETGLEVAAINSSPPTPEWLVQVMRNINGAEDPRLIYEKTLRPSDVNSDQGRLLIPFNQLNRNDFLTPEETTYIHGPLENNKKPVVEAVLVNERSERWNVKLRVYRMAKDDINKRTWNYAMNSGWNKFVSENKLEAGHNISIWSFRCGGTLYLALLKSIPTVLPLD